MLKKINVVKDLAKKIGREKANELFSIVNNDDPFTIEVKIKKSGITNNKDIIKLNNGQNLILEYIED